MPEKIRLGDFFAKGCNENKECSLSKPDNYFHADKATIQYVGKVRTFFTKNSLSSFKRIIYLFYLCLVSFHCSPQLPILIQRLEIFSFYYPSDFLFWYLFTYVCCVGYLQFASVLLPSVCPMNVKFSESYFFYYASKKCHVSFFWFWVQVTFWLPCP